MDAKTKLTERHSLVKDTIYFKKTNRIATMSNAWTWQVIDSDQNVTIEEAYDDWDLMEKAVREHQERYDFDILMCPGTRNCNAVTKALGNGQHMIHGNVIQAVDTEMIRNEEDYRAFMADKTMFAWTSVGPRRFEGLTFGQIEKAIEELGKYFGFIGKINGICADEYGVLIPNPRRCGEPLENYIDIWRGIKNFSIDLRRMPEVIDDLVAYHLPIFKKDVEAALAFPEDERYLADVCHGYLGNTILNLKQYERIYYPFSKYLIDRCIEEKRTTFIYWEADAIRFAPYFQDFPKGSVVIVPEQEDLLDIRKAMPNIAMIGGVKCVTLHSGTPQQCVDEAKRLVEGLEGGFILSQNKMMSFETDCNRENLLAVQEYVHSVRL